MKVQTTIVIDKELLDKLKTDSKLIKRSVSYLINEIISKSYELNLVKGRK